MRALWDEAEQLVECRLVNLVHRMALLTLELDLPLNQQAFEQQLGASYAAVFLKRDSHSGHG